MRPRTRRPFRSQLEVLEVKVVPTIATVPLLTSVPGGTAISSIGLTPGSAVPATVEQSMNTLASSDLLETFLSETELVEGTSPEVQAYAEGVILANRDADFTLGKLASMQNVVLPYEMNPTDTTTAAGVLASANTSTFDTAYLNAMSTALKAQVSAAQADIASLDDPLYVSLLTQALPTKEQALTDAQTLLANPSATTTTGNGASTPSTGASLLNATDTMNLQMGYTVSSFQYYIHQLTNVIDGVNTPVGAFSSKLAFDHFTYNFNAESIAFATNTVLPAGLPGNLESVAQQLIANVTPSSINPNAPTSGGTLSAYDQAYLTFLVPSHTLMISMDQATYVTAQNLSLKNLAYTDIFASNLHRQGAQTLLNEYGSTSTSTSSSGTSGVTGTSVGDTTRLTSNQQYVVSTYDALLDRDPSQADLSYWTGLLNRGVSRQRVYQDIAKSPERQSLLS